MQIHFFNVFLFIILSAASVFCSENIKTPSKQNAKGQTKLLVSKQDAPSRCHFHSSQHEDAHALIEAIKYVSKTLVLPKLVKSSL